MSDRELVAPPAELFTQPQPSQIVPYQPGAMQAPPQDPIEQMAIDLHRFDRLRTAAIAYTNPRDWHSFGGKPWPLRSACEKLGRACKINFEINQQPNGDRYAKRWASDEQGTFYLIEMSARAWMHGFPSVIEAFGFTSSRDPFLAQDGKDEQGNPIWKPVTEVNEGNVIQAAYTNLVANLTTRLLGISNVGMEELQAMMGGQEIAKTVFKTGKEAPSAEKEEEDNARRKRLWAMCLAGVKDDEPLARRLLADMSKFEVDGKQVAGVTDVNKLKGGRLFHTMNSAEDRWKKLLESAGPERAALEQALKEKLG